MPLLHWCPRPETFGALARLEYPAHALNYRQIFTFYKQDDSWRAGKFFQRRRKCTDGLTSIDAMTAGVDLCEREAEVVFCPFVFHTHCIGTWVIVGGVYLTVAHVVMDIFSILVKAEFDLIG